MARDGLTDIHVAAYSVGHFCNDLCASMYFILFTYYIKEVVELPVQVVATALLSGQIADGVSTILIGHISDNFNTRMGKRTPWYIFGTLFLIPTFLGIFVHPHFINEKDGNG